MLFAALTSALLAIGAAAAPTIGQRSTESDVTLYAYGTGINGLPILIASDGSAVVNTASSQPSTLESLTWTISTTGTTNWTGNANSQSLGAFYVIPTTDAFQPAGFVTAGTAAPEDAVFGPFMTYGTQATYQDGDELLSQFWAAPESDSDTYIIYWNSAGTSQDSAVPVAIKTESPDS